MEQTQVAKYFKEWLAAYYPTMSEDSYASGMTNGAVYRLARIAYTAGYTKRILDEVVETAKPYREKAKEIPSSISSFFRRGVKAQG